MTAKIILAVVFIMLLVGIVAQQLGYVAPVITVPDAALQQPWWSNIPVIGGLISADIYIVNACATFLALMTFQIEGIPGLVNTLIFVPIALMMLWLVVSLVRGAQG